MTAAGEDQVPHRPAARASICAGTSSRSGSERTTSGVAFSVLLGLTALEVFRTGADWCDFRAFGLENLAGGFG